MSITAIITITSKDNSPIVNVEELVKLFSLGEEAAYCEAIQEMYRTYAPWRSKKEIKLCKNLFYFENETHTDFVKKYKQKSKSNAICMNYGVYNVIKRTLNNNELVIELSEEGWDICVEYLFTLTTLFPNIIFNYKSFGNNFINEYSYIYINNNTYRYKYATKPKSQSSINCYSVITEDISRDLTVKEINKQENIRIKNGSYYHPKSSEKITDKTFDHRYHNNKKKRY